MVFVFGSIYVMEYIYRLVDVDQALHPWDEATCLMTNMINMLFDVLLQSVCQYFVEKFCIDVHHGYWSEVFFFS